MIVVAEKLLEEGYSKEPEQVTTMMETRQGITHKNTIYWAIYEKQHNIVRFPLFRKSEMNRKFSALESMSWKPFNPQSLDHKQAPGMLFHLALVLASRNVEIRQILTPKCHRCCLKTR